MRRCDKSCNLNKININFILSHMIITVEGSNFHHYIWQLTQEVSTLMLATYWHTCMHPRKLTHQLTKFFRAPLSTNTEPLENFHTSNMYTNTVVNSYRSAKLLMDKSCLFHGARLNTCLSPLTISPSAPYSICTVVYIHVH